MSAEEIERKFPIVIISYKDIICISMLFIEKEKKRKKKERKQSIDLSLFIIIILSLLVKS